LHHAEVITITGKSCRLRNQVRQGKSPNDPADRKKDEKRGKG